MLPQLYQVVGVFGVAFLLAAIALFAMAVGALSDWGRSRHLRKNTRDAIDELMKLISEEAATQQLVDAIAINSHRIAHRATVQDWRLQHDLEFVLVSIVRRLDLPGGSTVRAR